ncbi:UDP-N-acetylmuramoyl-tripeptide--D-alanyl-D-alanine ligase [bacterium]|nr:UDP-N-acetylmuramoyl-tripeptide--D-alanyl-D-alanine ligase [bacterium]
MELTLQEIITATGGKLIAGNPAHTITRVSTDTRTVTKGDIYLALKGARFNGHNFCDEALKKGAQGLIVSENASYTQAPFVLLVAHTEKALGDIAHAWRKKFLIPVIGLTGSSGKTTTKDMMALLLSAKGAVCKTEGNLNNLIGLPQTMMTLTASHQFAVWEMGMNHFGEIDRLAEMAQPDYGLITNIGHAHLEGLGSIEGVAKAKGELFLRLSPKTTAFVNADDARVLALPTQAQKILYGKNPKADIQLKKITYTPNGMEVVVEHKKSFTYQLPFVGEYLAQNFLAASSVALTLGLTDDNIQRAILNFHPGKMRGEETKLKNGTILVVDCYNANPDSTKAALKAVSDKFPSQKKLAVLGSMLELGKNSPALHREVGGYAADTGFKSLFAFGPEGSLLADGFANKAQTFGTIEELSKAVQKELTGNEIVLIKGSRGMQMERVAELLKNDIGV